MAAPQTANPGTRGQDSRYDTRNTTYDPATGTYVDDAGYHYPEQGFSVLSNDRPSSSISGLYPADDERSRMEGGGGGGGDYGGQLTASPYYQQYQSQIEAANAADLANTKSQLQQLLIQFGLVPEGFQDKYGALDDAIRQLIQQNTNTGVSQYARLLQAKDDARRSALNNLTARGLARSGAKGYALRRGTLTFNQNLSDALNAVLGNANTLQGGYASRSMDRTNSLAQFLAQLASSFNFRGVGSSAPVAPPAPPPPTGGTTPVYSAPAFQSQYSVGEVQPNGYSINTGGGFYTNQQTGDLTSKWQKLAGL